jgi:RHS repeat-associated protein
VIRNSAGAVESYVYNAWEVVSSSGLMTSVNLLRYRRYNYDSKTGLFYVDSRYYDPEAGRFLNADDLMP